MDYNLSVTNQEHKVALAYLEAT